MRKVKLVSTEQVGYMITDTTSGSLSNVYLQCGERTIMLEECLIWEEAGVTVREFDRGVKHCEAHGGVGVDECDGWSIVV
jgi:hypothetical protein